MINRACLVVSTSVAVLLTASSAWAADRSAEPAVKVDDNTFKCITDMTPVRHF
jgi:hypothetical protein